METISPKLYFIPGLGGDRRLFDRLKQTGLDFEVIEFIKPHPGEKIEDYAMRLAEKIDTSQPFILGGVSMGGILTAEIAKITCPQKVIFISTVKTGSEFPFYLKTFRLLPLHRILPVKRMASFGSRMLVARNRQFGGITRTMLLDTDPDFFRWAMNEAIRWRNTQLPENFMHLHGTSDLLFPVRMIKNKTTISGGTHLMVMYKSDEIGESIKQYIAEAG